MKKIMMSLIFIVVFVFAGFSTADASYYPRSQWVEHYYNNTIHSDGVYYGHTSVSARAQYIQSYSPQAPVIYQEYPVYYDVPVYYPVYEKPKPVCNDYRRGARYYENSDQGPNCNDRLEDWNNRQGLPNEFLASMYGTDSY